MQLNNKKHNLLLFLVLVSFSSCYTFKIFPKEARSYSYDGPRQKAYIINPELKKEYKILVKSKIYDLATDSMENGIVRVKLYPIKPHLVCGQPIVLSAFTLGQLPVILPDRYQYRFEEIGPDNSSSAKSIELLVATRYWFWDMFSFSKDFDGKAGRLLSYQYYQHPIVQQ